MDLKRQQDTAAMNFESRSIDATTGSGGSDSWYEEAEQNRKRKRNLIIGAVVVALIALAIAWSMYSGNQEDAAAAAAGAEAKNSSIPSVTVIIPGRSTVSRVISATGTLAARREMPVGVAGEGGQVVRVLVEQQRQRRSAGSTAGASKLEVRPERVGRIDRRRSLTEHERAHEPAGVGGRGRLHRQVAGGLREHASSGAQAVERRRDEDGRRRVRFAHEHLLFLRVGSQSSPPTELRRGIRHVLEFHHTVLFHIVDRIAGR